jgi:hypothetical protein
MKYILLIYHDEEAWATLSEAERQQVYAEYRQLTEDLKRSGQHLAGSQLTPSSTATSVRVRNGKQLLIDGPFAETKEQLGGYFLIEVASPSQATEIAARIPSVRMGTIEVRALA